MIGKLSRTLSILSTCLAVSQANLIHIPKELCIFGPHCTFVGSNTPLSEIKKESKKSNHRIAPLPEQYRIPLNSTPITLLWRDRNVVERNNCYNFATKLITNTFARPGRPIPHKFPPEKLDRCEHIVEAIKSDGFPQVTKEEVGNYEGDRARCSYFASVITAANATLKDRDFHFYRYGPLFSCLVTLF